MADKKGSVFLLHVVTKSSQNHPNLTSPHKGPFKYGPVYASHRYGPVYISPRTPHPHNEQNEHHTMNTPQQPICAALNIQSHRTSEKGRKLPNSREPLRRAANSQNHEIHEKKTCKRRPGRAGRHFFCPGRFFFAKEGREGLRRAGEGPEKGRRKAGEGPQTPLNSSEAFRGLPS